MKILPKYIERKSPTVDELIRLREQLVAIERSVDSPNVFIGFDGFVDKIQNAVKIKREGKYIFFSSIEEFAQHLRLMSGKSGQVELVTTQTKAGGNAPILSGALSTLKVKNFCLGSMGFPEINPLFQPMASKAETLSVNEPGKSEAIEFDDGKIILSDLSCFMNYDWTYIKRKVDLKKIQHKVDSCELIALVDWSNLPHATDIWQGFLDDVIKVADRKDFKFLFDLCDPSRKSAIEIDELLDLISAFSHYGKVTLALNENEARKIWMKLSGYEGIAPSNPATLIDIGSFIYYTMKIDTLLIHPIDRALAFQKNSILELAGRLVTQPKIQTGGGDNFNAGYCLGLLNKLSIDQRMLLSIVTAGAYVQNGNNPDINDVINYIDNWVTEIETDNHNGNTAIAV